MHRTKAYTVVAASIACLLASTLASTASAAPTAVAWSTATQQSDPSVLGSMLKPGQEITAGRFLESPNGRYRLAFDDGYLVVTKAPNRLTSERYEQGFVFGEPSQREPQGDRLAMQTDGNLVLYENNRAQDSTRTSGRSVTGLAMQDDGNLVLYATDGTVLTNFNTYAQDLLAAGGTLLPGEQLPLSSGGTFLAMQGDGNLVLYANGRAVFSTGTQGNPGAAAVQQRDGNLVVYAANGRALFNAGTSNNGGYATVTLLGPSDLRVVTSPADTTFSLFGTSWDNPTLLPGQTMFPGDRRTAPGGLFILQDDRNLVQYVNGRAVFVRNNVITAEMRTNGNFVAVGRDLSRSDELFTVFTTRTAGNPGSRLVVQGDGNLVVYTTSNKAVYSRK